MEKRKKGGTGLGQILLNVVILGVFSIVENWLLFYYESQLLPVIFGILMVMMCCLLTINIYNCVRTSMSHQAASEDDRQVQAVLYKQLKAMRTDIPQSMQEALEDKMNKQLEELKLNQLRSTKALMKRMEELDQMITASNGQEELETKLLEKLQEIQKQLSVADAGEAFIAVSEENEDVLDISESEEEESFEAEELPELEEEEGFETEELPELEEEGFETEELPELEEEGFEAEELPELEEEGFEAEELPELEEEEGFEAEELPELEEEEASKTDDMAAILNGDPNRRLSADEIAALFSGVN